jgi:predicted MFS family arabinose efflux permease
MKSGSPAGAFMSPQNRARVDNWSIAGAVVLTAIFVWLLMPRGAGESPPPARESSHEWPAVTRTLVTTVVVQPEDLDHG